MKHHQAEAADHQREQDDLPRQLRERLGNDDERPHRASPPLPASGEPVSAGESPAAVLATASARASACAVACSTASEIVGAAASRSVTAGVNSACARSEEQTAVLQNLMRVRETGFCIDKKKKTTQ